MLTVKTYLAPSAVHGIGLFAADQIPVNTIVWQYDDHIDRIYSEENFLHLCRSVSQPSLVHILNSSYKRGGRYYYLTDNGRFINHSAFPNIAFLDDYTEASLRQIEAGEEILENYLMSYDATDYFFQERSNPDPIIYLESIFQQDKKYAPRKDLS
jgi:SET domain-containing protein